MSELFIHIGSHKTGTTSVQSACVSYLASGQDVRYINIRPPNTRVIRSSGRLAKFQARVMLKKADQIFRPDPAAAGKTRFITSDEEFFWISEPGSVHRLAEMLQARYGRVTIICYLRRQDQLALSHRKQVLGGGRPATRFYGATATPLPRFLPHFHQYFDYEKKLSEIWDSAFGKDNVQVIPYARETLFNGDVVEDFGHRTGVRFSLSEPVVKNRSLDGDRTLAGLALAEIGVPPRLSRQILKELPGAGQFLPSRREAEEFLAHFAEANDRLSRNRTWNGAPFQFDRAFDMYPETTEAQWSNQCVQDMVMTLLRETLKGRE